MLTVNCSTVCFQCFNVSVVQVTLSLCVLLSSKRNDIKCKEGWLRLEHTQRKSLNQWKSQRHTPGVCACLCWAAASRHLSCRRRGEQHLPAGSLVEQGQL